MAGMEYQERMLMLFDDKAITVMVTRLRSDGWHGDEDKLRSLLVESNRDTAVCMFIDRLASIPVQLARNKDVPVETLLEVKRQFEAIISKVKSVAKVTTYAKYDAMGYRGGPFLSLSDSTRYCEFLVEFGSSHGSNGYWGEDVLITRERKSDDEWDETRFVFIPKRAITAK